MLYPLVVYCVSKLHKLVFIRLVVFKVDTLRQFIKAMENGPIDVEQRQFEANVQHSP